MLVRGGLGHRLLAAPAGAPGTSAVPKEGPGRPHPHPPVENPKNPKYNLLTAVTSQYPEVHARGIKVTKTFWYRYPEPSYWTITQFHASRHGSKPKVFGILTWRGKTEGKEVRIRAVRNRQWRIYREKTHQRILAYNARVNEQEVPPIKCAAVDAAEAARIAAESAPAPKLYATAKRDALNAIHAGPE